MKTIQSICCAKGGRWQLYCIDTEQNYCIKRLLYLLGRFLWLIAHFSFSFSLHLHLHLGSYFRFRFHSDLYSYSQLDFHFPFHTDSLSLYCIFCDFHIRSNLPSKSGICELHHEPLTEIKENPKRKSETMWLPLNVLRHSTFHICMI